MAPLAFQFKIDEIDGLIRKGKIGEARRAIQNVVLRKIPRGDVVAYANLARRMGLSNLALTALAPIVNPEAYSKQPPQSPATSEEKIEYAASLRSLGATREAQEILLAVDSHRYPQAHLQLAFCLISEWRYQDAIPYLQNFAASCGEQNTYQRLVCELNLLEAHIASGEAQQAGNLRSRLEKEIDPERSPMHNLKFLELAAQVDLFLAPDPKRAHNHLQHAMEIASDAKDALYSLLFTKWMAVLNSQKSKHASPDLLRVREEALKVSNWETVRDCDYYCGLFDQNHEQLTRVYFGTPYPVFRERTERALRPMTNLPETFLWTTDKTNPPSTIFDLTSARSNFSDCSLSPGQVPHRLLIILARDFYRPVPILSIFSQLFPDERFYVQGSAHRVHQAVARLRQWSRDNGGLFEINEQSGCYQLQLHSNHALLLPRAALPLDANELQFLNLRSLVAQYQNDGFTTKDVAGATGLSLSSAKTLVNWGVDHGKLTTEGRARRTRYKIAA